MYIERGLEWPWDREEEEKKPDEDPEHQSTEEGLAEHAQELEEVQEAKEEGIGLKPTPTKPEYVPPPVTMRIDVRPLFKKKHQATIVHRTQFDPTGLFVTMPEDIALVAFGEEHYSLVESRLPGPSVGEEADILAGLS